MVLALLATLGLYLVLPLAWRLARQHELSREVCDYDEEDEGDDSPDGRRAHLTSNFAEVPSDSELSNSSDEPE